MARSRVLRNVFLVVVCSVAMLTLATIFPDLIPHRVRHMTSLTSCQCAVVKKDQTPVVQHTTKIATKRELNIVDYNNYPEQGGTTRCVPLRIAAITPKICLHPFTNDRHVSAHINKTGGWETATVNSIRKQLLNCPDCQFIDIGANIGVFALTVASMGRKVIAVEPLKANVQRLVRAIKINGMQQTITLVNNAVSDVYENVSMLQPKDNIGGTQTASQNIKFDRKKFAKPDPPIATIKLDDLLQTITFKKAIMKIDIEGYEPRAFGAAGKLFEAVDIHSIHMEWGRKNQSKKSYIQPMLDFMTSRGYKVYDNSLRRLSSTQQVGKFNKSWPWDVIWIRQSVQDHNAVHQRKILDGRGQTRISQKRIQNFRKGEAQKRAGQ